VLNGNGGKKMEDRGCGSSSTFEAVEGLDKAEVTCGRSSSSNSKYSESGE
jgi:hypothetical protein